MYDHFKCIHILLAQYFDCQTYTDYFMPYLNENWQFLKSHAGIVHLAAKILCQKYVDTLKVVIHLGVTL
jgi:hypothetical protein